MPGDVSWLIFVGKLSGLLTLLGSLALVCRRFNVTPRRIVGWLVAVWAYETLLQTVADKDATILFLTGDRDTWKKEALECQSHRHGGAGSSELSRSEPLPELTGQILNARSIGSSSADPS